MPGVVGIRFWVFLWALFAWSLAFASRSQAETKPLQLVEMVVAQVGTEVITSSELLAETRLVLLRRAGPQKALAARLDLSLLRSVLQSMVKRTLILGEVRRLELPDVPAAELDRGLKAITRHFRDESALQNFLADAGLLGAAGPLSYVQSILRSDRQVERFLELRLQSAAKVDEADLRACYEKNRVFFVGRSFSAVRPQVTEQLRQERVERSLNALIRQLKRRVAVHYAPEFAGEATATAVESAFRCR